MVIKDDSLQYLENLEVTKKKVHLSGIVESVEVTCVGGKRYNIDSWVYYVLSQSTYNCLRQDFQLPSISTITKMISKVKTVVQSFLVH